MTTTTAPEAPTLDEIFTASQIARTAALQAARDTLRHGLTAPKAGDLTLLADYIIGSEPDELSLLSKPFTSSIIINGTINPDTFGLVTGQPYPKPEPAEPIVGDVTVHDAKGLEALPKTARLEDEDGDVWSYDEQREGWTYAGTSYTYSIEEIFEDYGDYNETMPMVLLNPEILGTIEHPAVEVPAEPVWALDEVALFDLPVNSTVVAPSGAVYVAVGFGKFRSIERTRTHHDLAEVGPILVAYVPGPNGALNAAGV